MNQRFCNGMVHVIKQGENLYQLSRMYRVPLALILRANPYVDVYNLQIGQEICIPVARPFPGMMQNARPPMRPSQNMTPNSSTMPMPRREDDDWQDRDDEDDRDDHEDWREQDDRDDRDDYDDRDDRDDYDDREDRRDSGNRMAMEMQENSSVYVCDGAKSLGDILRTAEISLEDFWKKNDVNRIIIAADVQLYLPKKV